MSGVVNKHELDPIMAEGTHNLWRLALHGWSQQALHGPILTEGTHILWRLALHEWSSQQA
jgi:hypothetical protein